MDMQVTNKYFIRMDDGLNYTVLENRKKKDKEEYYLFPIAYCSTFESACNTILKKKIMLTEVATIIDMKNVVNEALEELKSYLHNNHYTSKDHFNKILTAEKENTNDRGTTTNN